MSGEVHINGQPFPERPDPRTENEKARDYLNIGTARTKLNEVCLAIVDNESIVAGDEKVRAMFHEARAYGMSATKALHFAESFDKETRDIYRAQRAGPRLIAQDEHQKATYAASAIPGAMKASPPSRVNPFDTSGMFRKLAGGFRQALFPKDDTTPGRDVDWEKRGEATKGVPLYFVLVAVEGVEGVRYHEHFAGRPYYDDAASAVQEADVLADDPAVAAFVCRAGGELIRVNVRARTAAEGCTGHQAIMRLTA